MRPLETVQIAKVTGPGSDNRTDERFAIHGTDLGICWDGGDGGDGRVRLLFGDTYGAGWGGGPGGGPAHADWRFNVLAYSTTTDLDRGLRLDGVVARADGTAAQLLGHQHRREATVIPNGAIAVDGTEYLHYMSVREWGPPGRWTTNHGGLAVSTDGGASWAPTSAWTNRRRRDQRFQLGAFTRDADWVYLFGTTNGRFGGAYLARVRPSDVGDVRAYAYLGERGWGTDDRAAVPVFDGQVGELSVAYHRGFDRWLALHLDEHRAAIVLRTAQRPEGPWSDGEVVVSGQDYPGLYGGYLHPWSLDGPDVHYLISQWGPYNVFQLRTTFG